MAERGRRSAERPEGKINDISMHFVGQSTEELGINGAVDIEMQGEDSYPSKIESNGAFSGMWSHSNIKQTKRRNRCSGLGIPLNWKLAPMLDLTKENSV